jgi:two-component system, cell cycle sensor histidine kinase and response regulator CckA
VAERTFGRRAAAVWAAAVFVGIALSTMAVAGWMHGARLQQLEANTAVVAGQSRSHLSAWIDARLAVVETLAMRWPEAYASDAEAFRRDAQRLLRRLPGLLALNWVSADGVIGIVVPHDVNRDVLGSNLYRHPEPDVARALAQAADSGELTGTRTLELLQGGTGFAVYWPVHATDGSLAGFVNGVFRARELIDQSQLVAELGADYWLELRDLDGAVMWSNADEPMQSWQLPAQRRVSISGGIDLQLTVAPSPQAVDRAAARAQLATLVAIGWLLGALLAWLSGRRVLDQEHIRGSERRLREMLDLLPHPVYVKDSSGRFTYTNRALEEACGVPPEALIGATADDLPGSEEERRELARADLQALSAAVPMPVRQEHFTDAGGQHRLFEVARVPFRDPLRDSPGVMGIGVDVTARVEAESVTARIAGALDQAGEAITVLDVDGRIVFANPAFVEMMGYQGRDVRGLTMAAFAVEGSNDRELIAEIARTLQRGETWRRRYRSTWQDGVDRVRDATITPVRDGEHRLTGYIGVLRDVTREQRLEEQLRQSQKLEAVGQLAGGIAHDFNNLLTVILGYATSLQDAVEPDSPAGDAAARIDQAAQRAASLTRQLLTFSRRRTTAAASADLNAVVSGLAPMVERLIGENISVELRLDETLSLVSSDAGELEQIILNLCVNARDALQDGGHLILWTAQRDAVSAPADVSPPLEPGTYGVLGVSDNGSGMTPEVLVRVFEPFFTTKEVGAGTGLGLSMVYGIAEQRAGGVHVESAPGMGTTLTVWLPVADSAADSPASAGGETGTVPVAEATILVVEDEAGIRELMTQTLRRAGYRVISAVDGEDALRQVDTVDNVDLLVSDVVMPRMGGPELRERLSQRMPDLRVLFVSGYASLNAGSEALKASDELLEKPFRTRTLLDRVAAHLVHCG